jgi:formyltetrahydrofolate-dependent phosphoribosylglycinamide formyltransferase
MCNIAVFISGGGTNLKALLDAQADGQLGGGRVALVISDRAAAGGLTRAESAGVANYVVPRKHPERLLPLMREYDIALIALCGYLYILPAELVAAYERRIINIHPSLIPLFCGKGFYGIRVHESVIASGAKTTGATVHYVDEHYDTGAIIEQRSVPVLPGDTAETLQARVLETEHRLLVDVVRRLAEDSIKEAANLTLRG